MQSSRPRYRNHLTKLSTYETNTSSPLVLGQRRWGAAGSVQPVHSFPARFQGLTDLYEEEVTEEEVTTSITLISRLPHARRAIKLSTRQKHGVDGVFSFTPRLSVYNVLPEDSLVFTIVGQGLLQEFQTLLREGKASLRDQDENGASLLHVCAQPYPSSPDERLPRNSVRKQTPRNLSLSYSVWCGRKPCGQRHLSKRVGWSRLCVSSVSPNPL